LHKLARNLKSLSANLKILGEWVELKLSNRAGPAHRRKREVSRGFSAIELLRNPQPIDGFVTERPQYAGELATANQPLLTVMDTST